MTREECLAALGVSRETGERLESFLTLLQRWNPRINLVANTSLVDPWRRHILDSGQLLAHAPATAKVWADLGSGAGFPGLVVAALAAERRPGMAVTLVESDQRKAAFLREAARSMAVAATVRPQRIEALEPLNADVVSARALAPLDRLLPLALRHRGAQGLMLFLKGAQAAEELTAARRTWHIRAELTPSLSDPAGAIVAITEAHRADDRR